MKIREYEEQSLNDLIYKKMKKQLEARLHGEYAIIANGKFLGAEDSLEGAWARASPYKDAVVVRITKKPQNIEVLGNSLQMSNRRETLWT